MAWDFRELEGRDLRGQRRSLRRLSGQERALSGGEGASAVAELATERGWREQSRGLEAALQARLTK